MTMQLHISEPLSLNNMYASRVAYRRDGIGSMFSSLLHKITGTPSGADIQKQVDANAQAQADQMAAQIVAQQQSPTGQLNTVLTNYRMPILLGGGALMLIVLLKHHKEPAK